MMTSAKERAMVRFWRLAIIWLGCSAAQNLLATGALAGPTMLRCGFEAGSTLLIHAEHEAVSYTPKLGPKVAVTMKAFQTFRCPFCFSFQGILDGKEIIGKTHADFDSEHRNWIIHLEVTVDGQARAPGNCISIGE